MTRDHEQTLDALLEARNELNAVQSAIREGAPDLLSGEQHRRINLKIQWSDYVLAKAALERTA